MDVTPEKKRVWILGAGFSRSMGGPLIKDLLADLPLNVVSGMLPGLDSMAANDRGELLRRTSKARSLCAIGKKRGHWQDAEEFLEIVETAAADQKNNIPSHQMSIVTSMLNKMDIHNNVQFQFTTIEEILLAARQSVLLDTWAFLRGSKIKLDIRSLDPTRVSPERWTPYMSWSEKLGKSDTVLTFNYDVVPDLLKKSVGAHLTIFVPGEEIRHQQDRVKNSDNAVVLKLHGSTNWFLDDQGRIQVGDPGEVPTPLLNTKASPLLGLPGPTKASTCHNLLFGLWDVAVEALKRATHVYFLGYRFPQTDTYSQEKLLGALAANDRLKEITIVLGPEGPDLARMKYLLQSYTLKSAARPHPVPAWCADFLLTGNY